MCNHKKVYDVELDYWIYGSPFSKKQEVVNCIENTIKCATGLPDTILIDIVRSLHKIEEIPEEIFEENQEIFKNSEKIKREMDVYREFISIEKEDYWKHG